jgi:hypothetical protein
VQLAAVFVGVVAGEASREWLQLRSHRALRPAAAAPLTCADPRLAPLGGASAAASASRQASLAAGEVSSSPYASGRLLSADLSLAIGQAFSLSGDGFEAEPPAVLEGGAPPEPAPAGAPDGGSATGGAAPQTPGAPPQCGEHEEELQPCMGAATRAAREPDPGVPLAPLVPQHAAGLARSPPPVQVDMPSGDEAGSDAECAEFIGGQWGTPVKGGSPRGRAAERAVAARGPGGNGSLAGAPAGIVRMRRMGFEEISRMISGDSGTSAAAPGGGAASGAAPAVPQPAEPAEGQQQPAAPAAPAPAPAPESPAALRSGAALVSPPPLPLPLPPTVAAARDLPIAAAVADAEAAAAAAGSDGGLAAEASSDFSIGAAPGDEAAPDVGPRPPSGRASWRASRTTIDQVGRGAWG